MTIRAAIYARVSTDGQTTLNQRLALEAVIARKGWRLVEAFEDQISGSSAGASRPEMARLLAGIARRRFDVVMVWAIDRLGRSTLDVLTTVQQLQARGVDLYIDQLGVDTTTAAGKFFLTVMTALGELERAIIIDRIKAGVARARSHGTKSGAPIGRAPLDPAKEQRVRDLLQAGKGIDTIRRIVGVGSSTVRRIRDSQRVTIADAAAPGCGRPQA